ncbi:NAD-dependent epimerase/dehydratase family protein [Candidatus Babeliales bacterium]|nr:NAD-dependent epimerase/dehydratase family protein [Candidatus Babeliales bacterium]
MNYIDLLITGGTGLVGHALQKIQPDAVYISSKDFDLTKEDQVKAMYEKYKPDQVIHLAAQVGGIIKNINFPADLLYQNILMNSFVVHYAHKHDVKKFIGVLSNCSYPDVAKDYPMKEGYFYDGPPQETNFAYAYSKRTLGVQIESYKKQYKSNFYSVIPCNMYGSYDNFDKEHSHFVAALIRKIHEAKEKGEKTINLMGTGKPLRQYLFSEDCAKILLILMEKHEWNGPVNIAPKSENPSIAEIARIALDAMDAKDIDLKFDKKSPDGVFRKDISIEKLQGIIEDIEFTSLKDGIKKTYEWYLECIDNLKGGKL